MVELNDKTYKSIIMKAAQENCTIRSATVEITDLCNYKCEHCYIRDTYSVLMSEKNFYWVIDELSNEGCIWILLTGGEILCHPNFIEMYQYAYNKNLIITLFTNGFNFDDAVISMLESMPPALIEITLYGGTKDRYDEYVGIPGAFDILDANIRKLCEKKLPVKLKTVLTKKLYNEYGEIKKYAAQMNIPLRVDGLILPKVSGERVDDLRLEPNELVEEEVMRQPGIIEHNRKLVSNYNFDKKLYSCAAGKNSIFIDANVNACLCSMARHICVPIGPQKVSLKEAQCEILKIVGEKEELKEGDACFECKFRPLCRYCPGQFLIENGDEYKPIKWYCKYAKMLYDKSEIGLDGVG